MTGLFVQDSFTGAAGLKDIGPWGRQILLFRSVQVHLIPRHRIFHIALIPDVEMCFANVCISPSEGVIKWKETSSSKDIAVA